MKLITTLALALVMPLSASVPAAIAAPVSLTFTNMSGEAITSITATPKGETVEAPTNLLAAPIPAGDPLAITIDLAEGQCVFDVTFAFASGTTSSRPDTDLCQTDGIVVE